jgi:hypothetical protein
MSSLKNAPLRALTVTTVVVVTALAVALGTAAPGVGAARTGSTAATAATPMARPAKAVHRTCRKSKLDVPSCGVLWGMYTPPVSGPGPQQQHFGTYERLMGRRFDIVKNYVGWGAGTTFPTPSQRQVAANGRRILDFSWTALNFATRAKVTFGSIASGAWDKSVILPEARALRSFHHRVILDFNHEFDSRNQAGKGSPAQYAAAYRHIHQVMHKAGVRNVIWAWLTTGDTGHAAEIKASYPGAAYVDWVGYDPYNFAACRADPWRSPYQTFAPYYRWLRHQPGMKNKPIMLGEYGSGAGPRVRNWYAGVAAALKRLPRIKAVMQWDVDESPACDFRLTDSPAALAGFTFSAKSRYITGPR